ncbi:MAG: HAD family hydrolase [Oscillospiraceae bacterium]|nr:HAD family hydrolase [Oscillospiraceae bacterium]
MKYDGIIFDLDGTMWDSAEGIAGTWNMVLKEYPQIKETVTAEKLKACMGLPLDEIGRRLFPGYSPELQKELMKKCCDMENVYLSEHGGILYPHLKETLEKLAEKYRLFVVSNCQCGYIESFFAAHGTAKYFTDTECHEATGLSKGENNRLVMERNGLKSAVYVGDTQGDADSAEFAQIPFVYASYGFGSVKKYDYIIEKFSDLLNIL